MQIVNAGVKKCQIRIYNNFSSNGQLDFELFTQVKDVKYFNL